MKKKIKDLTLDECNNICHKQEKCLVCPLRFKSDGNDYCYRYYLLCASKTTIRFLEKEVEIDE